jgi:hypothetical protein
MSGHVAETKCYYECDSIHGVYYLVVLDARLIYRANAGAIKIVATNTAEPIPNPDQTLLFFFLCAASI